MTLFLLHGLPFAGLILTVLAGLCSAIANLCMRKSLDIAPSTNGYLLLQLLTACLISTLINPIAHQSYDICGITAVVAIFTGLCLSTVLIAMSKAIAYGPTGLSIAFINSSSIIPPMFLAWIFGTSMAFEYGLDEAIGGFLVVLGLFWASTTTLRAKNQKLWIKSIATVFIAHVLLLMSFQYRSLLMRLDVPTGNFLIPIHIQLDKSFWFFPLMFLTSLLVQLVFGLKKAQIPKLKEIFLGINGGALTCFSAELLDQGVHASFSTSYAGLVFPLYSVSILTVCSLWSQWLYKEQIKWLAIAIAMVGIALGIE